MPQATMVTTSLELSNTYNEYKVHKPKDAAPSLMQMALLWFLYLLSNLKIDPPILKLA